jgi:hypothetical protein
VTTEILTKEIITEKKADLGARFPTFLHGHRLEAMAFGYNFKTYATMMARIKAASQAENLKVDFDEKRFLARLYELDDEYGAVCRGCLFWTSNGTQRVGICSNMESAWNGLIVSSVKYDCDEHSEARPF